MNGAERPGLAPTTGGAGRPLGAAAALALLTLGGLWLAGALSPDAAGPWDRLVVWILEQQARFHRAMTGELGALRGQQGATALVAAGGLVAVSFLYGLFHAAGPGHGKAVIATYLLTRHRQPERAVRRGVLLAAAASLCQGLVALLLVYGLVALVGWLPRDSAAAAAWSERVSYALVAGVGLLLLARASRGLWRRLHGHAAAVAAHAHRHEAGGGACCHLPAGERLAGAGDWRTDLGVVLSIGLRPCSGALVVLVFARAAGLGWAGLAAVAAMSLGTAIAVSLLACLAVRARTLAHRLAEGSGRLGSARLGLAGEAAGLVGGLVILALGVSLLAAAFAPAHPLGLG